MKRRRLDVEEWNRSVERSDIAGPSRLRYSLDTSPTQTEVEEIGEEVCEECRRRIGIDGVDVIESSQRSTTITIPPLHPSTALSRRKPPRRPGTIPAAPLPTFLIPLILPFLAPAYAAPPPSRPHLTSPPTPTINPLKRRDVQYLTSVIYPTDLPTAVARVDETELPYILTQSSDGSWQKAEEGWQLYGKQAGGHNVLYADTDTTITNAQATFAVQSVLPKGWGQESSRTSFYRVPLIVTASVIIAIGIVVGIVIMVLNRRKAHRRAKRRAERTRRKALIAAGMNPDDAAGDTAEVAFKEKLGQLERQHRTRRKEAGSFVRTKVKRWNAGLRRRRGKGEKGEEGEGSMEVVHEDGEEDGSSEVVGVVRPEVLRRISADSTRSRTTPDSPSQDTGGSTIFASSPEADAQEEDSPPTLGQPVTAVPYFPPAYRPASVRSYRVTDAGPSRPTLSTTLSEPDVIIPTSETDKTRAPGYYPAPATEAAEVALAVVSRSDGKSRVVHAEDEEGGEGRGVAHVATDDKRVLERMRMGASAPPVTGEEEFEVGEEQGPSAPGVEVDEQGFERVAHMDEVVPIQQESETHPDIPAPPRPIAQKSYRGQEVVDEGELSPSAPPVMGNPSVSDPPKSHSFDLPSAPPLLDEDDGGDEADEVVPSAPDLDEDIDEPHAWEAVRGGESRGEVEEREEAEERGQQDSHNEIPVVTPVRYLPRYEP